MNRARTVVVVLLVAVLAVDLAAANAVVAIDRTVLNPTFVTTALDEEDAYGDLESVFLEDLPVEEPADIDDEPTTQVFDPRAVMADAIDAEYLQSQVEPNVDRTSAYLHGNADELEIVFDLAPVKAAIIDSVETDLTDASAGELLETAGSGEVSVDVEGYAFDLETAAAMADDGAVYRDERAAFRETARDRVIADLVDEAFAEASHDELLALVIEDYDPDDYTEAEKEQLVEDNTEAIRVALGRQIEAEDDGEIADAVDEIRETVRTEAATAIDESLAGVDPAVAEPAGDLLLVAVEGYAGDLSHDEFRTAFETAGDDLADAATAQVEANLDEAFDDEVDLTEDLDTGAIAELEAAREVVRIIDLLAILLPLVGLGLIGGIYLVSRSAVATAIGAGAGLSIGGLPALVGAAAVGSELDAAVAGVPQEVAALVLAITAQVTDAVLLQSAGIVGLGLVLIGAGLALHLDLVELPASLRA